MSKFRFQGGEVVRLRRDMEDLKAGCCGVVWGVYDFEPPLYEASFVHATGEADMMFAEDDVDEVAQSDVLPFAERLEELRRLLENQR